MMDVFTSPTPNGIKVPIAMEELGIAYRFHRVDLSRGGASVPELRAINLNAKIPAIVDKLATAEWLNGENNSIAEIVHFAWLRSASYASLTLPQYSHLKTWVAGLNDARPEILTETSCQKDF
jgi:glutathione S-transferase